MTFNRHASTQSRDTPPPPPGESLAQRTELLERLWEEDIKEREHHSKLHSLLEH